MTCPKAGSCSASAPRGRAPLPGAAASGAELPQDRPGARALGAHPVVLVVELALLQAEAAAADALVELVAGAGQQVDTLVDLEAHPAADLLPITERRRAALRELGELRLDLGERQAELLRDQDEADPADVGAQETALVAACAERLNQPLLLVEAQRGNRDAGTFGQPADGDETVLRHCIRPLFV